MEIGYNEGSSYDDKELRKHRSKQLSESKIQINENSKQLQSAEDKVWGLVQSDGLSSPGFLLQSRQEIGALFPPAFFRNRHRQLQFLQKTRLTLFIDTGLHEINSSACGGAVLFLIVWKWE